MSDLINAIRRQGANLLFISVQLSSRLPVECHPLEGTMLIRMLLRAMATAMGIKMEMYP
jgi:hypothetical protein